MIRHFLLPAAALVGFVYIGCRQLGTTDAVVDETWPAQTTEAEEDDDGDADEEEVIVSLADVPQAAKDAALAAVPGLVLEEGEREREGAITVYCLHGTANGELYEVEVTASGQVIEVETGEDEDD